MKGVLLLLLLLLISVSDSAGRKRSKTNFRVLPKAKEKDSGNVQQNDNDHVQLHPAVPPKNFTGPERFRSLVGQCFSFSDSTYEYNLCPFDNVTQSDKVSYWNAYHGILGVWSQWIITNQTYSEMHFADGDQCGSKRRNVNVTIGCGPRSVLAKALEPHTCQYTLDFKTPLACESMHVRDSLSPKDREELDTLNDQLYDEEITEKGFLKRQSKLFERIGLLTDDKKPDDKDEEDKEGKKEKEGDNHEEEHGKDLSPDLHINKEEDCETRLAFALDQLKAKDARIIELESRLNISNSSSMPSDVHHILSALNEVEQNPEVLIHNVEETDSFFPQDDDTKQHVNVEHAHEVEDEDEDEDEE